MERLLKELIQLEKKRNVLLTDIANSLTDIASKDNSSTELFNQMKENAGQSALASVKSAIDSAIRDTDEATQS